jgi:hypothetical protein
VLTIASDRVDSGYTPGQISFERNEGFEERNLLLHIYICLSGPIITASPIFGWSYPLTIQNPITILHVLNAFRPLLHLQS